MGDAGIALSPDANAGFWDLGKTPFATSPDAIGVTYTPWLKDIAQDVYMITLAGYHKLDDDQAFSGGIRYFNLGQIQFTDAFGSPLNTGRPHEFAIDFGYSRKISDALGIGVALRYINSSLANGVATNGVTYKAGNTFAADLSLYGDNTSDDGSGLTYGIALSNLGGKIGYTDNAETKDYIPANLGAGLAVFVGPAIVGIFIGSIGNEGVVWILAGLYFLSALLTKFITLPDNAKTAHHHTTAILEKEL